MFKHPISITRHVHIGPLELDLRIEDEAGREDRARKMVKEFMDGVVLALQLAQFEREMAPDV